MKYCNKCGEINNSKYGYCTECRRKVSREWYKNNSDKKKQYALDYLKKNNYPDGFQVLCWNCNLGRAHYGVCPHKM